MELGVGVYKSRFYAPRLVQLYEREVRGSLSQGLSLCSTFLAKRTFLTTLSSVKCQVSSVKCQVLSVKCQVSSVKCQMSNVKFIMPNQ